MKQQNIIFCLLGLGLLSVVNGSPIIDNKISLDIEITSSHIHDYKQYFNCEDPDLCKFVCFKALNTCWDDVPTKWKSEAKYSYNDCWNLSHACDTIDSGEIPEYKDYKTFNNYFAMNTVDGVMRNPAGVEIPYGAYRCNLYYDGVDQSYCNSNEHTRYHNNCDYSTPEELNVEYEDYPGHKLIEYCAMFKEFTNFDDNYVVLPTDADIHCYIKYFYLYGENENEDQEDGKYRLTCDGNKLIVTVYGNNSINQKDCLKNVELCPIKYPAEDCEKLSKVCDAMKTNTMPDFVEEQYKSVLKINDNTPLPTDEVEISLNVNITESHIRDYKHYFNCENPDLCRFVCFKALNTCWDDVPTKWKSEAKYSYNDCWNLSHACDTIDSGEIPEYKDYKTFNNYFAMNTVDGVMRNPAGVEIPYGAYRCNLYYDGVDQSYCNSNEHTRYHNNCDYSTPEELNVEYEDYPGHKLIEYCAMFKEFTNFDDNYVVLPTDADIHCYIKYFYLYGENENEDQEDGKYRLTCDGNKLIVTVYGNNSINQKDCLKNVELCPIKYPAEDCEKLSKVCDAMKTNTMPDFVEEQYNSIIGKTTTTTTKTTTTKTKTTTTKTKTTTTKTKTTTTKTKTKTKTTTTKPRTKTTTTKRRTKTTTTKPKTKTTTTKRRTKTTTTKPRTKTTTTKPRTKTTTTKRRTKTTTTKRRTKTTTTKRRTKTTTTKRRTKTTTTKRRTKTTTTKTFKPRTKTIKFKTKITKPLFHKLSKFFKY